MSDPAQPVFWRDAKLPFAELRYVADGHRVRYTPHSHEQWSVGAILDGRSSFLCGDRLHKVQQGDLVMMNAGEVHACNPEPESPWSYYMLHLDCAWLGQLLHKAGLLPTVSWHPTAQDVLNDRLSFNTVGGLCDVLLSDASSEHKAHLLESALLRLFSTFQQCSNEHEVKAPESIARIAYYLIENAHQEEAVADIAAKFDVSSGYLTRQFKRYYHMTPHAFRLNRRIQLGQIALKNGVSIIEVAGQFGFSDQAHFQRVFKARVAATPKQYTAAAKRLG